MSGSFATFTPPFPPLAPLEETRQLRFIAAAFGDGYTQSSLDGASPEAESVQLTFEPLSIGAFQTMKAFFEFSPGIAFYYALPTDGINRLWTATRLTYTRQDTYYSLAVSLSPYDSVSSVLDTIPDPVTPSLNFTEATNAFYLTHL